MMAAEVPPGLPPMDRPAVQLGKLIHDSSQNAYSDLHGLMDSLPEKSSWERRELLLDFAQKTRHRFLRILVAVRWAMDYAEKIARSENAIAVSGERMNSLAETADSLYFVRNASVSAEMELKLIGGAAEILSSGDLDCLPKIISRSLNLPEELSGGEKEAKRRIGEFTRSTLRLCLPLSGNVRVLRWRVKKPEFATRIGVEGAWCADVSLDKTTQEGAVLKVYNVLVMVASSAHAPSNAIESEGLRLSMTESQRKVLLRVCNDRIRLALASLDEEKKQINMKSLDSSQEVFIKRCTKMIEAMRDFLGPEVCAPLAMEHLYHQGSVLARSLLRDIFKSEALRNDKPIIVHYWRHHRRAAKLVLMTTSSKLTANGDRDFVNGTRLSQFISVEHYPPIDSRYEKSMEKLEMNAINLEQLLRNSLRARELARLSILYEEMTGDKTFDARVRLNRGRTVALTVSPEGMDGGLEFRIDPEKGSLRARLYAQAAYSTSDIGYELNKLNMRSISRPFPNDAEENKAAMDLSRRTLELLWTLKKIRILQAADIGASFVPAPGFVPKRWSPPYVPIEYRRPRSFISINRKTAQETDSTASNIERVSHLTFSKSDVQLVENAMIASTWIEKARCQVLARQLRELLMRERILSEKAPPWTPHPEKVGCYTHLYLPANALSVVNSFLILSVSGSWQIKLTTSREIFDQQASTRRWGPTRFVTYSNGTLTFRYPVLTQEAVRTFAWELKCAMTMATFGMRLPKRTVVYHMLIRTPRKILFGIVDPISAKPAADPNQRRAQQTNFSHKIIVERRPLDRMSFRVGIFSGSTNPTSRLMGSLGVLMEELMNAAREDVGIALAGVLERSCPVAAVVERVLFSRFQGQAAWSSVVQLRIKFDGTGLTAGKRFELDVDLREGAYLIVQDLGRAAAQGVNVNKARGRIPSHSWDDVINLLAAERRASRRRDREWCVFIKMSAFSEFMKRMVVSMLRPPPAQAAAPPQQAQQQTQQAQQQQTQQQLQQPQQQPQQQQPQQQQVPPR